MSISNGCGHRELIWNSRDGVTPFGTECPSCGGDLCHTDFPRDLRAPSYKPQHGQRVWTGMTREVAAKFAQIRLEGTEAYYREHPDEAPAIKLTLEELTEEIYGDGLPPMLVIAGYDYGN